MGSRAGQVRMAVQENKETIITGTLLLYVGAYLAVGLAGLTFPAQPAAAVYEPSGYSNPRPSGDRTGSTHERVA
ncbi:MAG: hypothetical protein ABEK12_03730, partial [Candidatus Nanohaloarchaea archaeon]